MITITVNGLDQSVEAGISVSALLVQLGLEGKRVAVELNRAIVPRSQHETTQLRENDAVEIVQAIGGG
jgi:sulfur carrier protein